MKIRLHALCKFKHKRPGNWAVNEHTLASLGLLRLALLRRLTSRASGLQRLQ